MKIMEYNIMSGRTYEDVSRRNYDLSLEIIRSENPDLVGLCEVGKQASAQFPVYELEGEVAEYFGRELGMDYYHGVAEYFDGYGYGVALLSKYPIKSKRTVNIVCVPHEERIPGHYYEDRCIAVCELDAPGGLTVLVSHFGLHDDEKVRTVDAVMKLLSEINTPVIFMGDLNMSPDDPKLTPIFEALDEVSGGRERTPLTIPSDDPKYKLDYIFTSKDFRAKSYKTIITRVSDHVPYIAEVESDNIK